MSQLYLLAVSDPIAWRGAERLLIVIGATVFGYLGYRLYRFGITEGQSKVNLESAFCRLILSGTGPGIAFMAIGGFVLLASVFNGVSHHQHEGKTTTHIGKDSSISKVGTPFFAKDLNGQGVVLHQEEVVNDSDTDNDIVTAESTNDAYICATMTTD